MDDLISRSALKADLVASKGELWKIYRSLTHEVDKQICAGQIASFQEVILRVEDATAVDAETVIKSLPYVKEALEMAKQSLVPKVRCKDCELWDREHIEMHQHSTEHPEQQAEFAECRKWSTWSTCFMTRSDDYCSQAKRRSDDATD